MKAQDGSEVTGRRDGEQRCAAMDGQVGEMRKPRLTAWVCREGGQASMVRTTSSPGGRKARDSEAMRDQAIGAPRQVVCRSSVQAMQQRSARSFATNAKIGARANGHQQQNEQWQTLPVGVTFGKEQGGSHEGRRDERCVPDAIGIRFKLCIRRNGGTETSGRGSMAMRDGRRGRCSRFAECVWSPCKHRK